jgi:prophage regulatory protein
MQESSQGETLLRLPAVVASTGLSRATIWRQIAAKKFPAPQKISSRCVAWRHSVLQQWIRGEWIPTVDETV